MHYRSAVSVLLVFLSGCLSLSDKEKTENLIPTPSMGETVDNSLSSSIFSIGNWPTKSWWTMFNSEPLNALIDEAIAENPNLESVRQRVEVARQEAVVARGKCFPLLFFDWNDSWSFLSENGLYRALNPSIPLSGNLIDLTFSFTYEFDFWGKYHNLFYAAIGREKAEEAEAAQVKLIITTGLAQAYFALKTNLVRERLYTELYEVRKAIFRLQELLLESALYSKLPVLLAKEDLFETEKLVLGIAQEIATDRHLINVLRGKGPDAAIDIDASLPALPRTIAIPKTLNLELLARRPDLMAQIWRVEALAKETGAAKADYYPNFNIASFFGWESFHYSNLFNKSSETVGVNPAMSLPLYTAGAIGANISAKKALFNDALFAYNNLILSAAQEIADILVLARSIFGQKEKQTTVVQSAEARYQLTVLRQRSGLDNSLQNYAYQQEVIEKQIEDIQLVFGEYLTTVKLIKALGGGYLSDHIPIQRTP